MNSLNQVPCGSDLIPAVFDLPNPSNYFRGRCSDNLTLPDNVLLFSRLSGSYLSRHPAKHFHHRHILLVPLRGKGRVIVNEHAYPISPGCALMVQPFQFHHYLDVEESIVWLFITYDLMDTHPVGSPLHHITDQTFWTDMQCMVDAYQKDGSGDNALIFRLALILNHLRHEAKLVRKRSEPDSGSEHLLLQVHRLVTKNRQQPLSLAELARQLGYSESHLRAKFRQVTGYSIGQFQRTLRLQHAASLLSQGESTVSETAEACGWDTPFSFSRAFRAYWGVPPRDFMKRNS